MAGKVKIEIDKKGIAEILKSQPMREAIDEVGERLARLARGEAKPFVTDRVISVVRVDASAQAKNGVLTKAATLIGLEVKAKVRR